MTDLGIDVGNPAIAEARAVSETGRVGGHLTSEDIKVAFAWDGGQITNLNALFHALPSGASTNLRLASVKAFNDTGYALIEAHDTGAAPPSPRAVVAYLPTSLADCNNNQFPDACEFQTLVSAYSRRANPSGPGGFCDLPASTDDTCKSEPRQGGITEIRFNYNTIPVNACLSSIEQASQAAPQFTAYTGASIPTCAPSGNELVCTFSPALENAYTYRFNVTGGRVRLRGLVGDVDNSGWTNATDRSIVVGVWTSPGAFSCPTDLNSSGQTNATDRSIVVGSWTSPNNKAPCPGPNSKVVASSTTSGWRGGTPRFLPGFPPRILTKAGDAEDAGGVEDDSADDDWTVISGNATLEIRPIGGGTPVDTLVAGQGYEVRYFGASHPVEAYVLLVSSSVCDIMPVGQVEADNAASPTATGMFEFVEIETDSSTDAVGEVTRCGMALDDQTGPGWLGGAEGTLCTFTAAATGALRLELWLSYVHESNRTTYETSAEGSFVIVP